MKSQPLAPLVIVGAALFALSCPAAPTAQDDSGTPTTQPNLLFLYLDDFGWRDAGFMGSDFYETPHLDRLASEGMVFTNAYSAAANCAPARASLLTGQYTPRHRIFNVGTGPRGKAAHRRLLHIPGTDTLAPNTPTWARAAQRAGYRTASMGKWHLSDDPRPFGFDVNVGGNHAGNPSRGYYPPHPGAPGLEDVPEKEYLTDTLSDRAEAFLRENRSRPWLLYLTHFAVHTPLDAKRELVAKYEEKAPGELHGHIEMATMIEAVDQGVGRLVAALEETGQSERTAIVFFSDNGGYGPATDMDPLKGYKGTYYEGGIRVPFFVKWPGRVPPGTENATPISTVDLFPTFCSMLGAELPGDHPLDGRDLLPLLTGEADADTPFPEGETSASEEAPSLAERPLFWHFPAYLQSYGGEGNQDEQRDPLFRSRPCSVVRLGDWKLHEHFEDGALELYHLGRDIGESENLMEKEPEKTAELHRILRDWREEVGAPVPADKNPEFNAEKEAKEVKKILNPNF